MREIKQIRLCGHGGQGIILAGTILGYACFVDGKWVAGSGYYGSAVRGGFSTAEIILSDEPIIYPQIIEADILVAMCQEAYDAYIENVKKDGIVIYDIQLVRPKGIHGLKQIDIPATSAGLSKFQSKQQANIIILGATVEITTVVTKDAFLSAVEKNFGESARTLNLKTVELGFELGRGRQ